MTSDDLHHLKRVLRLRRGETVIACDGRGNWRTCLYTDSKDTSGLIEADGVLEHVPAPEVPVVVGFVPVKGERPEWVVQKLTEVGVDRIVILHSTRAVVRWGEGREEHAVERLRRVTNQAAAQSRRAWLAELIGVVTLAELARHRRPGVSGARTAGCRSSDLGRHCGGRGARGRLGAERAGRW